MTTSITLYYSVNNHGDGSAYPSFYESDALAEWDQEQEALTGEGWGEPCTGSITVNADADCKLTADVKTRDSIILDLLDNGDEEQASKFAAEFFPEGLPSYEVTTKDSNSKDSNSKGYHYLIVSKDGRQISKIFARKECTPEKFQASLAAIRDNQPLPEDPKPGFADFSKGVK